MTHSNIIVLLINGFSMQSNSGAFSLSVWNVITTTVNYNIYFATDRDTQISTVRLSRLLFDQTQVEQAMQNYFDVGNIEGANNVQTSWPTIVSPQNLLFGLL